jgi:endo-1,4-beta-D-glucanase Y
LAGAPYPSSLARVANDDLDTAMAHTWAGIKARNISAYSDHLVHRPKSELPGDAVSEGQAYGMIVALYENDQTTFNSIWDAAESDLWSSKGGCYNWRWNNGAVTSDGSGMATDADQDIALVLLFADSLVKKHVWTSHTGPNSVGYKARALTLLSTIWSKAVTSNYNLAPGAGWGGDAFVNPGYFSPASYRIFAQADTAHDWNAVVEQCYKVIAANPGYAKGLLPDWVTPSGAYYTGSLGYNPFYGGHAMYKDGIRVLWRLALDWTWNFEPRAKVFLDSALSLIGSDTAKSNFYTMDGNIVPADSTFSLSGTAGPTRSRREHSHLTTGMWASASMAATDNSVASTWADALLGFRDSARADYWGHANDDALEDTAHNEMYFDQFLAWFGASVLAGRFSNIWADLADPDPGLAQAWKNAPSVSTRSIDFDDAKLLASARLAKSATWNITITHRDSGTTWSASGTGDTLSAVWNGLSSSGGQFPQGACDVVFSAHGLSPATIVVWVAHQKDLRTSDKNWLIIDDFVDTTLVPNFGTWGSFNNSSSGGNAAVSGMATTGTGSSRAMVFKYDLGTENLGYNYCGLEWKSSGWSGLRCVTKVTYKLKASHQVMVDNYLTQSDITDGNNFHVLDTVGTSWKTCTHLLSSYTGRLSNRTDAINPAKGTGFHWHIQSDKQSGSYSSIDTGHVQIDSFHVGGDLASMYKAPADYQTMPEWVSVKPVADRSITVVATSGGLRITVPESSHATVRDLSGRILSQATVPAGTSDLRVPGSGLAIVRIGGSDWSETRSVVRCPRN